MTEQLLESTTSYDLSSIDVDTLNSVACRTLNLEKGNVAEWHYQRIYGGAGDVGDVLSAVYRFAGTVHVEDKQMDWSLILKVVGTTADDDDPTQPRYWKREVLAYESGQLTDLPGGLKAPRFYGTFRFSEKVIGLWLEDLADDIGAEWPLSHYCVVARHLGQFNGSFGAQSEPYPKPWYCQDHYQHIRRAKQAGRKFDELRAAVDDPKTKRWFLHDDDMHGMLRLWEERSLFLNALDHPPQTLVHGDAFRRNLFARKSASGQYETVAIDWTYVGTAAIGFELASLVHGTLIFSEVGIADARELDQIVFEGYLSGLQDAGWQGDPRQVRLGYTASSAMIFGLGYGAFKLNESTYPWLEQAFGLPIDKFMRLGAELNRFFLELADEARLQLDNR
ncbi:MAG: phosphotransferase [Chloroflexota bacterium]